MIRIFTLAAVVISSWCLVGCLSSPITSSGGIGAVTVHDTNADAVTAAARNVFASRGYTLSGVDYPNSISFDKPAGGFGNVMWGSYGNPQTVRVRLAMVPIPRTDNIRLEPKVFSVSDAGEAGFDNERPLFGVWNAEFGPMMKDIARKAGD
jgi:hypothetical protein